MATLIERVKAQVIEAIQNLDSLDDLESVLDGIGLELDVTVLNNGSSKTTRTVTATRGLKGRKSPGVSKFWKKVRKIAKDRGVTVAEAKVFYLRDKEIATTATPKRKVSKSARDKVRRAQVKYWKSVDKVAAENNCSKAEARKILKARKAA